MRSSLLFAVLLCTLSVAHSQNNILYSTRFDIRANMPFNAFCGDRPSSYMVRVTIGGMTQDITVSTATNNWSVSGTQVTNSKPTSVFYADGYTSGSYAVSPSTSSLNDSKPFTIHSCSGLVSGSTSSSFIITPLVFKISSPPAFVCGNDPITLSASIDPTSSYDWYVGSGASGPWIHFKSGTGRAVTFNQKELPAGLDLKKPLYFKASTVYGGNPVETDVSSSITFFPAIPTRATISLERASCAGGLGAVTLSSFRFSDDTALDPGAGRVFVILMRDGDAPMKPIQITSSSLRISELASGNWTLKFKNDTACQAELRFTVDPPPPPISATATAQNPRCFGETGSISVSSSGGTGLHQYSLDGVNFQSASTFSGVGPGNFTVSVRDAFGCTTTTNIVTLWQPSPVTLSLSGVDNASGYGLANGRIVVSAGGGSFGYAYSLNGGPFTSSSVFEGLGAGSYSIVALDANGCLSNVISAAVSQPAPLILSVSEARPVSCSGNADGHLKVTGTGGVGAYQYSLTNSFPENSSGDFNFLAAGSYVVYVQDSQGNRSSVIATIASPSPLGINLAKTDVSCAGGSDGRFSITPHGGTGSYRYSLNGTAFQNQSNYSGIIAGTHEVTVMDSNGCTAIAWVTIDEPPTLTLSIQTKTDITCFNGGDGFVSLFGAGGSGGLQYAVDGSGFQSSPHFSGLSAGNHLAKVRDSNGCIQTISFALSQPPALTLVEDEAQHKNISCYGSNDGRIEVNSAGGAGQVIYQINGGQQNTTGIFSNLPAGDHVVAAIDDRGCTTFINVTLTQPPPLTFEVAVKTVSCFGLTDGKITLLASGGTGSYKFSINNDSFQSLNIFENLEAGSYLIRIKDDLGCEYSRQVEVAQPTVLSLLELGRKNISCFDGTDGGIDVTAQGGTQPYTYSIDGTMFSNATGQFKDLPSGVYKLRVRDANSCEAELQIQLNSPSQGLSVALAGTNLTCKDAGNGVITASAVGGTAPYYYSLNGLDFLAEGLFQNLSAGSYTLYVRDKNGCTTFDELQLTEPAELAMQVEEVHVVCNGDASGSIVVQPTGGTAPYQFSLNGGPFQELNTFLTLTVGEYVVRTMDAKGCITSKEVAIRNLYPPITLKLHTASPATCFETGSITVNMSTGGLPPYQYSLNNKDYSSSTHFEGLIGGSYQVFVKDANGCIVSTEAAIVIPSAIRFSVRTTNPRCSGQEDGSLSVLNASGGNENFLYSIDGRNYQESPHFKGLAAGLYVVRVKDTPFSCETSHTVVLAEPLPIQLTLLKKQEVSCANGQDGAIRLKVTGGTSPYFIKVNGKPTDGLQFSRLGPGNYLIEVSDSLGCSTSLKITLENPPLLTLSVVKKSDLKCHAGTNGSVLVAAAGGIPPYRFSLNGGAWSSTPQFNNLSAGVHNITVEDARGCLQSIATELSQPLAPVSIKLLSKKHPDCWNGTNGSITFSAAGGSGTYTYYVDGKLIPESNLAGLAAKTYVIEVVDSEGCKAMMQVELTQPDVLQATAAITQPRCFNDCSGEIVINITGGTKPYQITWLSNPLLEGRSRATNLCAGTYQILISDANNCTRQVQVTLREPPAVVIPETIRDTVLCLGQAALMDAKLAGVSYLWEGAGFRSTSRIVSLSQGGNYSLTLTDPAGCSVTKSFKIQTSTSLLKADFLVSSFITKSDTLVLIDVSKPAPAMVTWDLPASARVVQRNANNTIIHVLFSELGKFDIGMGVKLGECNDRFQKTVTVLPDEERSAVNQALGYKGQPLQDFKIFPNPTDGNFKVNIGLNERADAQLTLINYGNGKIIESRTLVSNNKYEVTFSRAELTPAVYMLILRVGNEVHSQKLIKL